MRAITLLALRASTGILLMIWGGARVANPSLGQGLSDKYYLGLFSGELLHHAMGAAEFLIGLFAVLGLFRKFVYPLQALVLGFGLIIILPYILDPFGVWLVEDPRRLFFPSTTVFFATLAMMAFKEYDTLTLDAKLQKPADAPAEGASDGGA